MCCTTVSYTHLTKHVINSGGLSYDLFWKEYKHKLSFYSSIQHTDRNSYYGAQQDANAYGKTKEMCIRDRYYIIRINHLKHNLEVSGEELLVAKEKAEESNRLKTVSYTHLNPSFCDTVYGASSLAIYN